MEYKEISAKTVSDAITQACIELGVTSDNLEIEVVSEGSKGFLGIGNKPAVIRYREKEKEETVEEVKETKKEEEVKEASFAPKKERKERTRGADNTEKKENRERRPEKRRKERQNPEKKEVSKEVKKEKAKKEEPVERTPEEIDVIKEAAEEFLAKVFDAMKIPVSMKSEYAASGNCVEIELSGDDMGVLIGKRGQTLDSLQYLTSLAVNRKVKEYVRVKIDTEDYRRRRKETLENLAKNIASKVKKTRKPVVLEPMNPYERRIIHSTLQPNNYVETYSEGNEPYRHVVVVPKK